MLTKTIIDPDLTNSVINIRNLLLSEIKKVLINGRPIVILCIGTDRSTGDSLGPLVGDKLKNLFRDKIILYGTLKQPVHARNICDVLNDINRIHNNPFIVAVDACLGSIQNVGKIIIDNKPLHPGSAMDKDLPCVGDISITGVVNISGAMDFVVLQNTRLYTVMTLADSISRGLSCCMLKVLELDQASSKLPQADDMNL